MANPLQQAAVRRKVYYVAAILGLFTLSILWRGKVPIPLSEDLRVRLNQTTRNLRASEREAFVDRARAGGEKEFFPADEVPKPPPSAVHNSADWLASRTIEGQASQYALDLRELEQGDAEIGGTAFRLSLTGARGFVVTALWKLAIDKQKRNEWAEFEDYVRAVTRLQPHFITPWIYQSWNLAYNVSVENDRLNDMYFYISRGIELLAEGERLNKKSPDMRFQIAFYYQNKFGVSDKVNTLRCLMQLSSIPPADRRPDRFRTNQGGTVAVRMSEFQDFCRKNPQLVRRLREKLSLRTPDDIVQFLEDNIRIPGRYDRDTGQLAKAQNQFPILPDPVPPLPDEYTPRSQNIDDTFDAFHAARAWYEYSLTVLPPPSPEPVGFFTLSGEDQFKYRMPKAPALIIFRQGAPRAQSYLAERLAKEGGFAANSKWFPDARADTDEERWFPRAGPADFGPGDGLQTGSSSLAEWRRAYERWKRHGEQNGLQLDAAKRAQYERDSFNVPYELALSDPPDEVLAKLGITRQGLRAARAMRNYSTNRHMTNFSYFLGASEAESDPTTAATRSMLWDAERMASVSKPRAIELYAAAIAKWREVLMHYRQFHHPEMAGRSDKTEEDTYEIYLDLVNLLEQSERVESRVRRLLEAARALGPVDEDKLAKPLAFETADREAGYLVAASDDRVKRRVAELNLLPAEVKPGSTAYLDNPKIRELVAKEFAWLPLYKDDSSKDEANMWVAPDVRRAVRDRLGLSRPTPPPANMQPPPSAPPNIPPPR